MAVLVTRLKACVADNWTRGLLLCNSGEQTPSSHSSCHNLLLLLYSFCVMIGYPILVSKPWNGQEVFWATVRIWWQELHSKSATFHCLVRSEPPQGMAPYASAQGPHAAVDWSCLHEALRAKVHNEEVESSLQMTSAPRKASYAKEAVPTRFFDCCAHRKKKGKPLWIVHALQQANALPQTGKYYHTSKTYANGDLAGMWRGLWDK